MRSLFSNELCNFSANSRVENPRNANELGLCTGGVVWVDPYDVVGLGIFSTGAYFSDAKGGTFLRYSWSSRLSSPAERVSAARARSALPTSSRFRRTCLSVHRPSPRSLRRAASPRGPARSRLLGKIAQRVSSLSSRRKTHPSPLRVDPRVEERPRKRGAPRRPRMLKEINVAR